MIDPPTLPELLAQTLTQGGADPLAALRDIHVPPVPPWWPPPPGWWVSTLLGLVLLFLLIRRMVRRYRRGAARREALAALRNIRERADGGASGVSVAADVAIVLRRMALHRYPRDRVAGLRDRDWLAFLDATGGPGFVDGPGSCLVSAPYRRAAAVDAPALIALAMRWVRQPETP